MQVYDRRQRQQVDVLVEEYSQHTLTRRDFLTRAAAIGLSTGVRASLLAACGTSSSAAKVTKVEVLNVWGGDEQASFKAVVAPFTQQQGITVNLTSTRDLDAELTTRIRGNNPPDIAILPNPGKMQQLASQHKLTALDSFLDMSKIRSDYANAWIDLGSANGKFYALFYKAANKGTVWYSPKEFQSNNYTVPKSWDDLITLSDQIAGSGKYPWSMGVSSQAASGWPATDWLAEIYLNESGPDMYDKWVAHKIPWTDASIKSAFQKFGSIVAGKQYINRAPPAILPPRLPHSPHPLLQRPPPARTHHP